MGGVYFISDPRKTFVGSEEVRQRGKEANDNCVNKLLLRQLGSFLLLRVLRDRIVPTHRQGHWGIYLPAPHPSLVEG